MSTLTLDQLILEMEQWRKTKHSHYSQYPQNLKKKVLSLQTQYSLAELSKRLMIPSNTLANWMCQEEHSLKQPNTSFSFTELPPMVIPTRRIILKTPSGMEFTFEGEVKTEFLAELALALSRRELP
jgi:hypothetical protein